MSCPHREALERLLSYTEQIELLVYAPGERPGKHPVAQEARAALARECGWSREELARVVGEAISGWSWLHLGKAEREIAERVADAILSGPPPNLGGSSSQLVDEGERASANREADAAGAHPHVCCPCAAELRREREDLAHDAGAYPYMRDEVIRLKARVARLEGALREVIRLADVHASAVPEFVLRFLADARRALEDRDA